MRPVDVRTGRETNPSDEQKQSARDQGQAEVPACPSSPLVDKDLDAIGEEDKIHPLEKEWATCEKGSGRSEDIP